MLGFRVYGKVVREQGASRPCGCLGVRVVWFWILFGAGLGTIMDKADITEYILIES